MIRILTTLVILAASTAAQAGTVCGRVVQIDTNQQGSTITIIAKESRENVQLKLVTTYQGTSTLVKNSIDSSILQLAAMAASNPGSLDFCANFDGAKNITHGRLNAKFR